MYVIKWVCVPIKLYLQKQAMGHNVSKIEGTVKEYKTIVMDHPKFTGGKKSMPYNAAAVRFSQITLCIHTNEDG